MSDETSDDYLQVIDEILEEIELEPQEVDLVTWSGPLPLWQRDALRRIAQKGNLSGEDKVTLKSAMYADHGLDTFSDELIPFSQDYQKGADETDQRCIFCSIGPVRNVNQLSENQPPLRFATSEITLIYGDNGSGKTGYCRIAKKVCRARVEDEILGNAFTEKKQGKPSAKIRWQIEGIDRVEEFDWSENQTAPKTLSAISVFDSKNAALYVDGDNQMEYLPFEVDLVKKLAELCAEYQEDLSREIKAIKVAAIQLPPFTPETKVSSQIKKIDAATGCDDLPSEDDIEKLAAWSAKDRSELESLKSDNAQNPVVLADTRARCINSCETLLVELKKLEKGVSETQQQNLKAKTQALQIAKEANDAAAAKTFEDTPLKNVGSDAWQALFEHAKAYAELAYPGQEFPFLGDGAKCVFCQQELGEAAKARLKRFDDFVKEKAAQEFKLKSADLTTAIKELNEIRIPPEKEIRHRLAEFENLNDEYKAHLENIIPVFRSLGKRKDDLIAASTQGTYKSIAPFQSYSELLLKVIDQLRAEEQAYRETAVDSTLRQKNAHRIADLEDRKTLSENKSNVIRYRKDKEKVLRLNGCVSDMNLTKLSTKVTELRRAQLTKKLNQKIENEIRTLGLAYLNVKVVDRTDHGGSKFKSEIGLKSSVKKNFVLSEGEQRGLALACFLAEAGISPSQNGLIFDDPVSSLDHQRIERVAGRLVDEAKDGRQIIIFTHNLVFYQEIISAAAKQQVSVFKNVVHHYPDKGFGVVEEDTVPHLARKIGSRIADLQKELARIRKDEDSSENEKYRKAVESFCAQLRKAWERLVETVLLNGVVERFNYGVKTQSLKGVSVTDEDYKTIFHAMAALSDYVAHDEAAGKQSALPDLDDLQDSLKELEEYYKKIKPRANKLSKEREKLEQPPAGSVV